MAQMFPESLALDGGASAQVPTEGERVVFEVLRDSVGPDRDYSCFYEAAIGEDGERRWPDFVLFGREVGLFTIEVKDWRADQIVDLDHSTVRFSADGVRWNKRNPERQAKSYADRLRQELRRHGVKPTDRGCGIPVRPMVALPFISRADYLKRRFDGVIPEASVLLADDLDPASDRFIGLASAQFEERLRSLQVFPCPHLTQHDVDRIRDAVWPRSVAIPNRAIEGRSNFNREVKYLDRWQSNVARTLRAGHQLVKGPPGSGKTLILVQRCKHLFLHHSHGKRILLLCYNLALASFLKRLVQEQGVATGKNGAQVWHFFELCSRVTGQTVEYDYKPSDEAFQYYQYIVEETERVIDKGESQIEAFDVILVDEGQDFDDAQLRIVRGLLRDGGDLVIALDAKQDLYNPGRKLRGTWKSLGIEVSGRVTTLQSVYRSTRTLGAFCDLFVRKGPVDEVAESDQTQPDLPFPSRPGVSGTPPELVACTSHEALIKNLLRDLAQSIDRDGYCRGEIAVIYDDKNYEPSAAPSGFRYGDRSLGESLAEAIESAGIPVQWVSQDVHSKRLFDVTRDSVVLSSVHSAKGLDFDLVYLIHPGWPDTTRAEIRRRIEPTYVAMTRAKFRLVVLYEREDQIVRRMIEAGARAAGGM